MSWVVLETWAEGDAYEAYMGRWSREVAVAFLDWLEPSPGHSWLDVGCGTGVMTAAILARTDPTEVLGVDLSEGFLAVAHGRVAEQRASFCVGDASSLPLREGHFGAVVSGLVLNFVPEPLRAVGELVRVAEARGVIAAYLWDYAVGMAMLRHFWDAAVALDPAAADLDEGRRFPLCRPDRLRELWTRSGVQNVSVEGLEISTRFVDFDDYWIPFLGGQGPAPGYVAALTGERRRALRDELQSRLPFADDGSIPLTARAWAVRGRAPVS